MCIIIDPPLFIKIYKKTDPDFMPIYDWIEKGNGKFVIGGSLYKEQLSRVSSILNFIIQLQKRGKIRNFNNEEVDRHVKEVKKLEKSIDFDDPHLVALVRVSNCRLVGLNDRKAHRFLTDKKFYVKPVMPPKLFTRSKNKNLLNNENLKFCC